MPKNEQENKVYSVSQITRKIRTLLEFQVGEIWVEGEISNLRKQASGHQYFTLKDPNAQLAGVLFRGNARTVPFRLQDGQQVQAYGELSVYEARGQYQLIIRHLQSKGAGTLQAKFEALKNKLQAEGLFDAARKKSIPDYPSTIALVTSPTSAALQDMINILSRRAPWVRTVIYPVPVQGHEAADEVAEAISFLNKSSGKSIPPIDVIVAGRGGGSVEDLWCFNEERVARAIGDSSIPTVSAVGHEIDFTIADFVSDLRAPTPSAAAELIVPNHEDLVQKLTNLGSSMNQSIISRVDQYKRILGLLARGTLLREPSRTVVEYRQQLDFLASNLISISRAQIDQKAHRLGAAQHILQVNRPDHAVAQYHQKLQNAALRIHSAARHFVSKRAQRLNAASGLLRSLGPEATFARGFTMTQSAQGDPITSVESVRRGERVRTRLGDGEFESEVT